MNAEPPVPDQLFMFNKQFSLWTALKVCRWWLMALVVSAVFDVYFPEVKKQMPLTGRIAMVFAEFLALLLFAFDAKRLIRQMDELQRRIAQAALFFSVGASFFVFALWLRLEREGFFNAVLGPPFMNGTWGIASVAHTCVLLGGFYGVGFLIFKRRYK
ncbi:MAG TPA: hypothetical protein VK327_09575 [Candidatus Paceibacterota bacterium]|nr:hypothetical protein [Candidatus Paceibacterota bacterium]